MIMDRKKRVAIMSTTVKKAARNTPIDNPLDNNGILQEIRSISPQRNSLLALSSISQTS
jgi:hypothetical protein